MEFLLQLFADFIGDPKDERIESIQKDDKKVEERKSESVPVKNVEVEEPVLFGLMQFH